jgi:SPX domain protein involved in polyphosphate accumulation
MVSANVFKRYELKYFLTPEQYEIVMSEINNYTIEDEHGMCTIQSLYYDTPNKLIIRRSIEKPVYKEKLRVRSYGLANDKSKVYVELKKKYNGVVFKRRIGMKYLEAMGYLDNKNEANPCQIASEIDYFKSLYVELNPSMLLIYDRRAYYAKNDEDLRITFDTNIKFRDYALGLDKGFYGESILSNGYLMEIKTGSAIPLWLAHVLSENHIYKTSFSKYGTAYETVLMRNNQEVIKVG